MTPRPSRIDWESVRARLDEVRRSLDRAGKPSLQDVLRVREKRAERLARSEPHAAVPETHDLVLVCRVGVEKFGFPASNVTEVLSQCRISLIPGAPSSVLGAIQLRGEIRPVYSLPGTPGFAADAQNSTGAIVMLHAGSRQFGIRVDAVDEIRTRATGSGVAAQTSPHIAWITEDLVSVLNINSLLGEEA